MSWKEEVFSLSGAKRHVHQEWGLAKLESRAAELLGQPHLLAIPLLARPANRRVAASIQTNTQRDAILTFKVYDPDPRVEENENVTRHALHQLVFSRVAHLTVTEEFQCQHRDDYEGRGYVFSQAFYELRNSRELRRLHHPNRHRLTHWILYLWSHRVEVFAEDFMLRLGDAVLPPLLDSEPQALTEPAA